jgi:hypothetical protein
VLLLLIKWLLVVPVYVVLVIYWIAVAITTLLAAIAILVTGRYPSGLFGFAQGTLVEALGRQARRVPSSESCEP